MGGAVVNHAYRMSARFVSRSIDNKWLTCTGGGAFDEALLLDELGLGTVFDLAPTIAR